MRMVLLLMFVALSLQPLAGRADELQMPDEVRRLATEFLSQQSAADPPSPQTSPMDLPRYGRLFMAGFANAGLVPPPAATARRGAYDEGRAYWHEHPERRENIFKGFGYTRVAAVGVWSRGFEDSSFTADGGGVIGGWLTFLPDAVIDPTARPKGSLFRTVRVRVSGYLSPRGRYGHLGLSARELLVSSVSLPDLPALATRLMQDRWLLKIEDTQRQQSVSLRVRFTAEPAFGCLPGVWRRVIVEEVLTDNESLFPSREKLSFDVLDDEVRLGPHEKCDAYLQLRGRPDAEGVKGEYLSFSLRSAFGLRGFFTLERAP